MANTDGTLPTTKILVREKEGFSLLSLNSDYTSLQSDVLTKSPHSSGYFSADGRLLALASPTEVTIVDASSGAVVATLPVPAAMAVSFSPKNTFLQTFQKVQAPGAKNLTIWRIDGGEAVLQQHMKTLSKDNWPAVQFSADESCAARCLTNEVQLWDPQQQWGGAGGQGSGTAAGERLRLAGMAGGQLAPNPPSHLAVFLGESKGAPASVRVFRRPVPSLNPAPCARRSFFKANSCRLLWAPAGSRALLALSHADVDKSNQSYYGESSLHFLAADGSIEGAVPLSKEGPVHDVQWSPSGDEFVVVYGFMPAKATLFDLRCKPRFDFGSGARNTVRWSPQGRYLCLAGFGNLPGDVEFWTRTPSSSSSSSSASSSGPGGGWVSTGAVRCVNGVALEWAPQGHHVMVATTAPRMQVDNSIRIVAVDGSLVLHKTFPVLLQAEWRPVPDNTFPNTPYKPAPGASPRTPAPAVAPPKPSAAYRPPGARSQQGSGPSSSSAFRAKLSGEKDAPRVLGGGVTSGESKSAAKNRKRREKEKAEPAASEVTQKLEKLPLPSSETEDVAKKIRALNKKLRQIEELKKKASDSGAPLTAEQNEKIKQEKLLREEISNLESST